MKNNLLNQTLERALVALGNMSGQEIRHLSTTDQAFTLDMLPACKQLANIRMQLTEALCQQLNRVWISEGDLHEVFLVLGALWKYDSTSIGGDHLAYAIQRLIRSEVKVGGPYHSHGIVEIAANLQIASFVQLVAKPLPSLDAFLDQAIVTGQFEDTRHTSPAMLYVLATLYDRPQVRRYIASCRSRTPAYRAVALATIESQTPTAKAQLQAICTSQQSTGFWPQEMLLYGKQQSRVATTALIVKALTVYRNATTTASSDLQQRHQLVTRATRQLFSPYANPLRESALTAVDKICSARKAFEITLLSYFFAEALKHPAGLTEQQFAMLGAASVCGWVAYTIYDDFLDDEGAPAQLPVANITMRASLDCFRAVFPRQHTYEHYVADVFNKMDEANAWEVKNCRFTVHDDTVIITRLPQYGRQAVLAARSFAHALGPIAVLNQYAKIMPQQTHHIESAFRHYLIARQLSDDLHDWMNDMQAGQASYVVITILRDMHLRGGTYNLPVLLSDMHKQFRHTTMPQICALALRHISKARKDFEKSDLLQPSNRLYTLLDELELSLRRSLDQHSKAQALVTTQVSYSA